MYTVNATRLKNYKNELMLASVGLRVVVVVSILALTYSRDMIVVCSIIICNKTCLVI